MQSPTSTTARALIERARASATERRAHVTTLHLGSAQPSTARARSAGMLRARRSRALDVRQAFRAHHEPEGAFSRVEPRARRIAQAQGCEEVTERHLLAAAFSDPESAAAAMLVALRQDPNALAAAMVQTEVAAVAPPARVTVARTAVAAAQGQRAPSPPAAPTALISRAALAGRRAKVGRRAGARAPAARASAPEGTGAAAGVGLLAARDAAALLAADAARDAGRGGRRAGARR